MGDGHGGGDGCVDGTTARADAPGERTLPRRRGKPRIGATAVRECIVLDPGQRCPDCGGTLRLVGEDVAEMLELIASQLKVIETANPNQPTALNAWSYFTDDQ